MKRLLFLIFVLSLASAAQTTGNYATKVVGIGPPVGNCDLYQIYSDFASGILYNCGASGWVVAGGGLPSGITYVGSTLVISSAGAGNGALGLSGNTSGTATLTAPAAAGTASNPIVSSNALQLPLGVNCATGASIQQTNGTRITGIGLDTAALQGSTLIGGDWAGCIVQISSSGLFISNSGGGSALISFTNTTLPMGTVGDLGIYRQTAGILGVSTGPVSNENGLVRSGNTCKITADITLASTATNICSFTQPALAKAWAWSCNLLWSVTAGTSPTISIGVNPSQTPTGATNATAEIITTNTGTATENTVALSASGALNILTSPTLTPAATIFQASTYGTVLASATAGTFAITSTLAGTTPAGVIRAGSSCSLN